MHVILVELTTEFRELKTEMNQNLDRQVAGLSPEDSLRSKKGAAMVGSSVVIGSLVRNLNDLVSRVDEGKSLGRMCCQTD
jgi:hypothetical protein